MRLGSAAALSLQLHTECGLAFLCIFMGAPASDPRSCFRRVGQRYRLY